jgi:hypothetical protein
MGFVRKLEGKRPFGRPRHRRDDIKWVLKEMSRRELVNMVQDRDKCYAVEGTVTYVRVPKNAGNLATS